MKKISIIAVFGVLAATSAIAASVVGTKHDMVFSGFASAPVGGSTEVCIFCHTPHGAQADPFVPLWNNTAALSVDATMYTSATMNFVTNQASINATDARMCLACHDGGVGAPINQPNSGDMEISTTTLMGANALLSTNMSNDHPIGMDLGPTPKGIDPGIRTIADIKTGFGGASPFYGSTDDSINIMWCSTCHDVHDNANAPFLRISNVGSAMCKACHEK